MKKLPGLLLSLLLIMTFLGIGCAEENAIIDFSVYDDDELLALLTSVQNEVVNRRIEKTAHLTAGTYVGGRDIPVGSYILTAEGTEDDGGIISLRSVNDPENDWPSKLYEFIDGDKTYSVFVTIEEGDTLILPFPYAIKISVGVMFH